MFSNAPIVWPELSRALIVQVEQHSLLVSGFQAVPS